MMRLKNVILGIALVVASVSFAQENVIKANPIGLAVGIANVGYEFAINDTQSITVSGIYYGISSIKGYGAGAEYRFYFGNEALKGWHAGPNVNFLALENSISNFSATVFTVGGEVGHQWIFDNNFVVDAFAGYSVFIGADTLLGLSGGALGLGASIGYAW